MTPRTIIAMTIMPEMVNLSNIILGFWVASLISPKLIIKDYTTKSFPIRNKLAIKGQIVRPEKFTGIVGYVRKPSLAAEMLWERPGRTQ